MTRQAWLGEAWHGKAWQGLAWQARFGTSRPGGDWLGKTWQARRGAVWRGVARQGRRGEAWHGKAWQGMAAQAAIQFWNKRHGRQVVEYVEEDRVREDERRKAVKIIDAIPCKLWAKQWSMEHNSRDTYRFANYMRSRLVEVFRGEAQPLASGPAYGGPEKRYWLFAGHKDQALQQYGYMTIVSSYGELRHAQERLSWSIGRGLQDDWGDIYDWWQLFDADACVVVDQEGMDLAEDTPPDA